VNRRQLLKQSSQAAIGAGILLGSTRVNNSASRVVVITNPNTRDAQVTVERCECDPQGPFGVESLARVLMAETGEWKEQIRDRRDGKNPIIFTHRGCCCCEISLQAGAHHPDWTYKVRPLSADELSEFRCEYGNTADLLTSVSLGNGMGIRGFVLNGRIPGWNLSVQQG
jgi:hypothetical protein